MDTVGINQQGSQDQTDTQNPRTFEAERQIWSKFAEASNVEEFCQSWLAIQSRLIADVVGGLVLLGPPDQGPFTPVAVWPDVRKDMQYLTSSAERALQERRGLLIKNDPSDDTQDNSKNHTTYHIAYPLESDGHLHGVVVLDLNDRPEAALQAALRQLHWGSAWLEVLFYRKNATQEKKLQSTLIAILDLLTVIIEQNTFKGSILALTTELATELKCDRVSIGFIKRNYMVVKATSHSAQEEKKSNLVRAIGAAMDEALDQKTTVVLPQPDQEGSPLITAAHKELSSQGSGAICTVLLDDGGNTDVVGALVFERNEKDPFDQHTIHLCESIGSLLGPILESKRLNDRWWGAKFIDSARDLGHKLVGPRHTLLKLITFSLVFAIIFFSFVDGEHRVSAKTVVEGKVQRVISSPFAGYVKEAMASAGDVVKAGQVLAILDDKDLKLEYVKLHSQKGQLSSRYREAMAKHDRVQIRVIMAQARQLQAQLDLIVYQLQKTKLTAPFNGVIIKGDLRQSLGTPVEKGKGLFEIAPLDSYRVILQVDEHDILNLKKGQKGLLVLSSLPGKELTFSVQKITPVSVAKDGSNYFRVEAQLDKPSNKLRPGMEGVGKVSIGDRKLIWIWTHKLWDWLRLWAWSWWP